MHHHAKIHGMFGHRGFGPGKFMGGMGNQVRRGDVQPAVVALLAEKDMHGYQIIQELGERTGGAWTPSAGSIYPTLQALEDQGMVTSEQVGGKRVYTLTDEGRAYAESLPDKAPWEEAASDSDPTRRLRDVVQGLMAATWQVGRAGTPTQIENTTNILDEARKRIYEQLAGDE
jgi:DNA-binding PadR family transcriptional regulator